MHDLITITILEAANDNTLSIIVDEPCQPHWAACGEYDPDMMEEYWAQAIG